MVDRIRVAVPPYIDLYNGPSPDADLVETTSDKLQAYINLKEQDLTRGAAVIQTDDGHKRFRQFPDSRIKRLEEVIEIARNKELLTPKEELELQGILETILFYGKDPQPGA